MKKRIIALLTGAMLMMATSAMATIYSPSLTDLMTWTAQYNSTPADTPLLLGFDGIGSVQFGVSFGTTPHNGSVVFGQTFAPSNLGGADTLMFQVNNTNETSWNFAAVVHSAGNWYYNPPTNPILNGTSETVSFNLQAFGPVDGIGVWINNDIPNFRQDGSKDFLAEFSITPVPEPGTMMLLGFGMLGLAIYGKRRMNKEA